MFVHVNMEQGEGSEEIGKEPPKGSVCLIHFLSAGTTAWHQTGVMHKSGKCKQILYCAQDE